MTIMNGIRRMLCDSSVLSLTKDSRFRQAVRVWDHDQDRSMHLAVTWGSGDAGRVGERAEHAAETRLAGTDCAAVGGACWGDGDHPRGWQEQGHGGPLAGALSGPRHRRLRRDATRPGRKPPLNAQ